MKHSLLALTLLSTLTISHTTTPMPPKTTTAGIACLTGAGMLAAKHAKTVTDSVVSATKTTGNAIKNGTINTTNNIKNWYENDRYSGIKMFLGLATTGSILHLSHLKTVVKRTGIITLALISGALIYKDLKTPYKGNKCHGKGSKVRTVYNMNSAGEYSMTHILGDKDSKVRTAYNMNSGEHSMTLILGDKDSKVRTAYNMNTGEYSMTHILGDKDI